ncbi:hypothetical protein SCAR479_09286 [Seiridium cardinale]|uniref:Uncharacterized protein n=1 Tax=Seiridium cardinale TaxID=138064 RepID=A0ABR2XJL9_9PEZI
MAGGYLKITVNDLPSPVPHGDLDEQRIQMPPGIAISPPNTSMPEAVQEVVVPAFHTQDHKHTSQMLQMYQALDRETQYSTVLPSTSRSKKSSDASSVFSASSFSSTRQLLKGKLSSSRRSSKKDY